MKHLYNGVLPNCNTIEEAEQTYRVSAMLTELRGRRVASRERGQSISIKEIESHFDRLRDYDPEVYKTILYTTSELEHLLSDCSDEEVRNVITGNSRAKNILYGDHDVIRHYVSKFYTSKKIETEELVTIRTRILELYQICYQL